MLENATICNMTRENTHYGGEQIWIIISETMLWRYQWISMFFFLLKTYVI